MHDISKGALYTVPPNSFTLWLITQLHGDASFAHSSGVVFMKSFHKRLTPSTVLSVCFNFTTCSVNAFSILMHCTTF